MARNFNGTSAYLEAATTPVTATPLTIAAWFRSTSTTTGQVLCSINANAANNRLALSTNTLGNITAAPGQGATTSSATASAAYTANVWGHGCAVFASSTSRTAYFNGGNSGTATGAVTPTGLNRIQTGARFTGSAIGGFFSGDLAEVAIWNIALSAADVAALATGVQALAIRPEALVFYLPLVRDIVDQWGRPITVTGTSVVAHPRIFS